MTIGLTTSDEPALRKSACVIKTHREGLLTDSPHLNQQIPALTHSMLLCVFQLSSMTFNLSTSLAI